MSPGVGNFFLKAVFTGQIDDVYPLFSGQTDPWGIPPAVKIPSFDVLRGFNLGYEHGFHIWRHFMQESCLDSWGIAGDFFFRRGHPKPLTGIENFTEKTDAPGDR
jgi:hypothetical protein